MICPRCDQLIDFLSHEIRERVKVSDQPNFHVVVGTDRISNEYTHECGQKFRGSSCGDGAMLWPIQEQTPTSPV